MRVQVEDSARKDCGNVYYWGRRNYVPRHKLAEYTGKAKELYALDVKGKSEEKERSSSGSKQKQFRSKSRSESRKRDARRHQNERTSFIKSQTTSNADGNVVYNVETNGQPESKPNEKLYFQQESPDEIIYTERHRYAGGQLYSIYHSSCSHLDKLRDFGNDENVERDKKIDLGFISDGTKW